MIHTSGFRPGAGECERFCSSMRIYLENGCSTRECLSWASEEIQNPKTANLICALKNSLDDGLSWQETIETQIHRESVLFLLGPAATSDALLLLVGALESQLSHERKLNSILLRGLAYPLWVLFLTAVFAGVYTLVLAPGYSFGADIGTGLSGIGIPAASIVSLLILVTGLRCSCRTSNPHWLRRLLFMIPWYHRTLQLSQWTNISSQAAMRYLGGTSLQVVLTELACEHQEFPEGRVISKCAEARVFGLPYLKLREDIREHTWGFPALEKLLQAFLSHRPSTKSIQDSWRLLSTRLQTRVYRAIQVIEQIALMLAGISVLVLASGIIFPLYRQLQGLAGGG